MSQVVQEDGIVQSSEIGKFGFKTYEKRVVEFGQNQFPLNLYPDDPPPSGFKITDEFGGNGVICAIHEEPKE
jgi:hypothetical protein